MRIDSITTLQQAATNYRTHGAARVVACFHGVVALGMSGGAAFVLLPRGLSAEGGPEVRSVVALCTDCCCKAASQQQPVPVSIGLHVWSLASTAF